MPLSPAEKAKLLDGEIVFLATTNADGSPHLVPLWFVVNKKKIYFQTDTTTLNWKNIQRNNRIVLCFGGRETYIIEGTTKHYKEGELVFPIRKLFWEKYDKDMDDSFINEKTLIFEVMPEKETSWHYAPDWD